MHIGVTGEAELRSWVGRVRHDLCKRLLWPARDRRDLGGAVRPGELVVALTDDEGRATTASGLWQALRTAAPAEARPEALEAFEAAVAAAEQAAGRDDLAGVLTLEAAFEALARNVK
jgi:hypothetical protein